MEASEKVGPPLEPAAKQDLRGLDGEVEVAAMIASDRGTQGAARLVLMLDTVLERLMADGAVGDTRSG